MIDFADCRATKPVAGPHSAGSGNLEEDRAMERISRRKMLAATGAAGAVAVTVTPSWGASFKIAVAAGHPPHFLWVKLLKEYFIPEVDKRLKAGGKHSISWNQGYGGTIAKIGGVLEAIEEGVVEMGFVGTIFEAAKMPLQNVSYVSPFGSADIGTVTGAIGALQQEIPAMGEAWTARGQRYLAGAALDTYHLLANFPVRSLDDLKGRKILAPGPAANWIKGTGAVAVAGNLRTYYNDIKTGVADGVVVFTTGAWGSKVFEVAPYINKCNFGSHFAGGLSVNLSAWNGMPAEIRTILTSVGAEYGKRFAAAQGGAAAALEGRMVKAGAKRVAIAPALRKQWAHTIPNVARFWASGLEKKGLPGKAVLKGFMGKLKASGADIPRDWSAE